MGVKIRRSLPIRMLAVILPVIMITGIFCTADISTLSVNAAYIGDCYVSGDYKYHILDDGTAKILEYTGNSESVSIPSVLGGKKVTVIGYASFNANESMVNVTIPNTVTTIESSAFDWCKSLKSVTIPNSVTMIGTFAFRDCPLESIYIPEGVEKMGHGVFSSCHLLTHINVSDKNKNYTSIDGVLFSKDKTELVEYPNGKMNNHYTIPNGVKTIREEAFFYHKYLTSVTIPNTVTEISGGAFSLCHLITSIEIPASVQVLKVDSFSDCSHLASFKVSSENKYYSSKDGVLFNKDRTVLYKYFCGKDESCYVIPDSVKETCNCFREEFLY